MCAHTPAGGARPVAAGGAGGYHPHPEMRSGRIAIIGGGPVGLEAALYGHALGYDVRVYERGPVAANVAAWEFVTLFTPWRMITTPLGLARVPGSGAWAGPMADVCPSGAEFRERYLLPMVEGWPLGERVRERVTVSAVGRDTGGLRLLLTDAHGRETTEHADVVMDCSGTYGNHRFAGRGGIPAPGERGLAGRIWYTLPDVLGRDRAAFSGRHTLLVGCGYSAATVVRWFEALQASAPETRLTWAVRQAGAGLRGSDDDPRAARRHLTQAALRLAEDPPAWLTFVPDAGVERLEPGRPLRVALAGREPRTVPADEVVALVGYTSDTRIYDPSMVGTGGGGAATGRGMAGAAGPDLFLLGAKSFGGNPGFLVRDGHRQIREAFRVLRDDPELDLYGGDPGEYRTPRPSAPAPR